MKIIITEDQFEKLNLIKLSDLDKSGTWSPGVMVHAKEGREPYVFENGEFIKRSESINKLTNKVVYLSENGALKLNQILSHSRKLESEAKKMLTKSKTLKDIVYQHTGLKIK